MFREKFLLHITYFVTKLCLNFRHCACLIFHFYFILRAISQKILFTNMEPFLKDGEEFLISKGVKEEIYRI